MRSKCRKLKMEHDIQIVIIDYLQLMSGNSGNNASRQQEISDISRGLKALARELNVPVIALSQLSRAVEQRPDHRPMLSDLRESGAIEQDADVVMFLYREGYYNRDLSEAEARVAEVICKTEKRSYWNRESALDSGTDEVYRHGSRTGLERIHNYLINISLV